MGWGGVWGGARGVASKLQAAGASQQLPRGSAGEAPHAKGVALHAMSFLAAATTASTVMPNFSYRMGAAQQGRGGGER